MLSTRKSGRAIVVATSDRIFEETLRSQFEDNYRIFCVRRGAEAIMQMLEKDIDLLILDVDMSGQVGVDILPIIRKLRPRLPVVLISEDFTHRIRKAAAEQGVTFQSVKPHSSSEAGDIVAVTEKIISHREAIPVN